MSGGDGVSRRLSALEKRLAGVAKQQKCSLCATRGGACPECNRPIGPYAAQRQELLDIINHRLDNLAERSPTDRQFAEWRGDSLS